MHIFYYFICYTIYIKVSNIKYMSTQIGIGKSKSKDAILAAKESVQKAIESFGETQIDMVFVYATFGYNFKELISEIKKEAKGAFVVGGTVFGVIDKDGSDTELNRVLVCVISSTDFQMTPIIAHGLLNNSLQVGKDLREGITSKNINNIKGLFLMLDGLHASDPDSMLKEVSIAIPKNVAIFGGSAAEPLLWKNTYQFYDEDVFEDSVVGVVFSGNITIEVGSSHGSQELGGVHVVTKAEGPRIFEIDNKPAIELFTELYGEGQREINAVTAAGVCLGTKIPSSSGGDDHLELRIPLSSSEDGSIVMAASWSVGTKIYICQRNVEMIASKNTEVIDNILKKHNNKKPILVFESDCLGRSADQIGNDASKNEIDAGIKAFGGDMPWFGAYVYGELASLEDVAAFHNWTGAFACFYTD
jgi:hypothetical protein